MYWLGIDVIVRRTGISRLEAFHALDRLMDAGKVEQHPSGHPNYKLSEA